MEYLQVHRLSDAGNLWKNDQTYFSEQADNCSVTKLTQAIYPALQIDLLVSENLLCDM